MHKDERFSPIKTISTITESHLEHIELTSLLRFPDVAFILESIFLDIEATSFIHWYDTAGCDSEGVITLQGLCS